MNAHRQQGLYRSEYEHDACGVGLVANLSGKADHAVVEHGMTVLKRLMHRGATGNDPQTGDGAGLLLEIPRGFFRKAVPGLPGEFGVAMVFGGDGEEAAIEEAVRGEGCQVLAWREVPHDPEAVGRDARKAMPRIRQIFVARSAAEKSHAEFAEGAEFPSHAEGAEFSSHAEFAEGAEFSSHAEGAEGAEFSSRSGAAEFERKLLVVRRQIERAAPGAYVCSCSSRTVVYKGLLLATQIERFYPDLSDPDFVSPFAIVHQRYSTNTFPSWKLAHPFRAIAHNGEINALKGNLNALAAREPSLASPLFGDDIRKLLPVVAPGQSDSASLDNMFELLVAAGRDAPHAMMMLVPQAWGKNYHMGRDVRAFCEYHSALMEPWDGPAAIAFTDGKGVGAALDRNGLRPARWTLAKDGLFVLASETGVLDIPPENVARRGRLKPGSILWLDLAAHRLMEDAEVKTFYARRRPYRRWVEENRIPLTGLFKEIVPAPVPESAALAARQAEFGWTLETVETLLRPMAETGHEPVGAMGNDAALACLRRGGGAGLFDFFHQLFAQVTNPPIDPIREELVMSIMTYIGNRGNILAETPEHAHLVKMTRPVLTDGEMERMRGIPGFPAKTLPLAAGSGNSGGAAPGKGWLRAALDSLERDALAAVRDGAKIVILSDRARGDAAQARIPSLLAVAAVNKALAAAGLRPSVGVVVESGEVSEVHHFAVLLGFGATAVNPWLALATVSALGKDDPVGAAANYVGAVCKGIMKIMSKMGISTLRSYRSARIFEAVGLGPELMAEYFSGVASPVGGLELEDLENFANVKMLPMANANCQLGTGNIGNTGNISLPPGGEYRFRNGGPEHLWNPARVADFREAVRRDDFARFRKYTDSIDRESGVTLRSQLEFVDAADAKTPPAVEPVESIVKRFVGGAMSLGSLSPEAHETIALALNGLGTMSNCGEGGENPERFGTDRNSAIKQVASGRFGVTVEYLRSAKDLQIKLAQGAKPGEGGQLPAHKVDAFVARLRHAKPGTTLISPPPHHDIYSIEDLAQLINDLKCANPAARVSVKLVSEAGVGTIAAGVAKAHADVVVISGFDGGTGAAPLTSQKHAGLPWELGLAEAHQTLLKNDLRHRVKLQVDGQLRTGRDIVVAAILGADEFAFGTSMLVSLGCVQCRNCNLDTCPVGIATQRPELRARFAGRPEHLQRYFRFLAEETREILASLGLRSLAEAKGRTDLLAEKAGCKFDFGELLARGEGEEESHAEFAEKSHAEFAEFAEKSHAEYAEKSHAEYAEKSHAEYAEKSHAEFAEKSHAEFAEYAEAGGNAGFVGRAPSRPEAEAGGNAGFVGRAPSRPEAEAGGNAGFVGRAPSRPESYDERELVPAAARGETELSRTIANSDRSVGAGLSGWLAEKGGAGKKIRVSFTGVAGQSFGAFLHRDVEFELRGQANDYVGKSLSGGVISIRPEPGFGGAPEENAIAGNVIAYGATSGAVYASGLAGERFGIRNSGATLVAEGIGDHGCEYMTGGTVAVIGPVGVNFAAGMTGGVAYVYDEDATLDLACNLGSVDLFPVEPGSADETGLRALLEEHVRRTGSPKASRLLASWPDARPRFVKVLPRSEA